jgi:hypothetical protein
LSFGHSHVLVRLSFLAKIDSFHLQTRTAR